MENIKSLALAAALAIGLLAVPAISQADTIVGDATIDGTLTEDDLLADDGFGTSLEHSITTYTILMRWAPAPSRSHC